jgi:hypothetical protein
MGSSGLAQGGVKRASLRSLPDEKNRSDLPASEPMAICGNESLPTQGGSIRPGPLVNATIWVLHQCTFLPAAVFKSVTYMVEPHSICYVGVLPIGILEAGSNAQEDTLFARFLDLEIGVVVERSAFSGRYLLCRIGDFVPSFEICQ